MGSKNVKQESERSELTEEELEQLSRRSKIPKDEIVSLHRSFITEYKKGYMNKKEFVELFKLIFSGGKPEKFATFAFKAFDKDKSGKITFAKFLNSTTFLIRNADRSENQQHHIEFAFQIFDLDRNGKVTKKEMIKVYTAICELGNQANTAEVKKFVDRVFKTYASKSKSKAYLDEEEFVEAVNNEHSLKRFFEH